jgi:tol-pal system protein YbgF
VRRHRFTASVRGLAWACALGPLLGPWGCAAPARTQESQLDELRGQVRLQGEQLMQQQNRLEQLELKLAAAQRTDPKAAAPAAPPAAGAAAQELQASPGGKQLQTVKLLPPASLTNIGPSQPSQSTQASQSPQPSQPTGRTKPPERRPSLSNPVDRAPRLPAHVALKEPDATALAELEQPAPAVLVQTGPKGKGDPAVERSFAEAVSLLNDGNYLSAQTAFLSFAAHHPRHSAADQAVYYAGLARAASGDCSGALQQFTRVERDYPKGDAAPAAQLESGRCQLKIGQKEDGRAVLERLLKQHPHSPEASQAQRLLAEVGN